MDNYTTTINNTNTCNMDVEIIDWKSYLNDKATNTFNKAISTNLKGVNINNLFSIFVETANNLSIKVDMITTGGGRRRKRGFKKMICLPIYLLLQIWFFLTSAGINGVQGEANNMDTIQSPRGMKLMTSENRVSDLSLTINSGYTMPPRDLAFYETRENEKSLSTLTASANVEFLEIMDAGMEARKMSADDKKEIKTAFIQNLINGVTEKTKSIKNTAFQQQQIDQLKFEAQDEVVKNNAQMARLAETEYIKLKSYDDEVCSSIIESPTGREGTLRRTLWSGESPAMTRCYEARENTEKARIHYDSLITRPFNVNHESSLRLDTFLGGLFIVLFFAGIMFTKKHTSGGFNKKRSRKNKKSKRTKKKKSSRKKNKKSKSTKKI